MAARRKAALVDPGAVLTSPLSARYIGFCPCCGADFKVRDGLLVHHGYKRPGHGYIVGDCFGVGKTPHELSPNLAKQYLGILEQYKTKSEQQIVALETAEEIYELQRPKGGNAWPEKVVVCILKSETDPYKWKDLIDYKIVSLKYQIRMIAVDIVRVRSLVETWQPKPLTTLLEEKAGKQKVKAVREDEKAKKKAAKLADQVSKFQKRIDSALRTKNTNTLGDIYSNCYSKLRQIDNNVTPASALAMLNRDRVWAAFGLRGAWAPLSGPQIRAGAVPGADQEERARIVKLMQPSPYAWVKDERIAWPQGL